MRAASGDVRLGSSLVVKGKKLFTLFHKWKGVHSCEKVNKQKNGTRVRSQKEIC